jgi:hypothetical protein
MTYFCSFIEKFKQIYFIQQVVSVLLNYIRIMALASSKKNQNLIDKCFFQIKNRNMNITVKLKIILI